MDKQIELLNDVKGENSACCGAPLYGDICSDCKEHSGPEEDEEKVCDICGGTGEVGYDEMIEPGIYAPTGVKKCICQEKVDTQDRTDEDE
jgi:hypothetical protein